MTNIRNNTYYYYVFLVPYSMTEFSKEHVEVSGHIDEGTFLCEYQMEWDMIYAKNQEDKNLELYQILAALPAKKDKKIIYRGHTWEIEDFIEENSVLSSLIKTIAFEHGILPIKEED